MMKFLKLILFFSLAIFSCKAYGQNDSTKIVVVTGSMCNGKKKKNFEKKYLLQSKIQLDTLNYLKQFEANKANYIGQPFSNLLNVMTQIQPKTVWSLSIRSNKKIVKNTSFKFCEKKYSFYDAIALSIIWQNDISITQTDALGMQNHFFFTNDEKAFYGSKIIKDIKVYR